MKLLLGEVVNLVIEIKKLLEKLNDGSELHNEVINDLTAYLDRKEEDE